MKYVISEDRNYNKNDFREAQANVKQGFLKSLAGDGE